MIKNLHNYKSFFKKSIFFIAQFIFFQLLFVSNASAQSYNDGGIRVKVWVHAVYADANCEERTPIPFIDGSGRNQKYVFKDIQVRGQHSGTSFRSSNPVTFNVTGRNNRFWKADAFRFYDILGGGSSNLLTPPEVPWGNLPILAKLFQPQLNTAIDNTRGLLIFDETFSNESAPSVIQWRMDDAWENDCNLPGNNNYKDSPDPICNENFISLPSYLYSGECVCRFTLIPKICIFGICTPEIKLPWIEGLTPLYGPRGDDHRQRKNDFSTDAIPFRSGSPGVVNYFMSEKMGTGGDGGYAVVFAYQWEFINEPSVCNSNANGNVSFAANPLGGNKIDGPIDLYVSFDRIFSASDFDGGSNCFGLPNVFGLIPIFAGDENLRVRWAARDNLDPAIGATTNVFGHIGDPNGELTQNRPRWNSRNVPMLEKHYCDYPNTCLDGNINMSGFQVKVDAWEEDGCGPDETFSTSNCLLGSLFSGGVDGDDNFSTYTSPVVNWRLSPPNTDNYYYLPINVSNSSLEGWFARVKYRWEIQDPVAHLLDTTEIINKCYNVGGPIVINSTTTNATYMQWEYSNWSGPSGAPPDRCPPEDAVWFEATGHPGARCENLTVPANEFRGTRYYRLKVFNRNGAGSKSSSGDKYAVSYSECKRISITPYAPPFYSSIGCSNDINNPIQIGGGSAVKFNVVQIPDTLALSENQPMQYRFIIRRSGPSCSDGGSIVADITVDKDDLPLNYNFPVSPLETCYSVQMQAISPCGTFNYPERCYFYVTDPECGPIYVSHSIGSNGTTGTKLRPLSNLRDAFNFVGAGRTHIKIEGSASPSDIYNVTGNDVDALLLSDNLIVEGGYTILPNGDWIKDGTPSIINSSIVERFDAPDDNIAHVIAFRATDVDNWVLQDLDIYTSNPPTTGTYKSAKNLRSGLSNYPVLVQGSSGFQLLNVRTYAGDAGNGYTPPRTVRRAVSGIQNATAGGPGTSEGPLNPFESYTKGGNGGLGSASGNNCGLDITCPQGANGWGCPGNANCAGSLNGRNGYLGVDGPVRSAVTLSDINGMVYYEPGDGFDGTPGGGGGGGGGAGGSNHGGAGGEGGYGGLGGGGGGTSFGIFVSNSSSGGYTGSSFTKGNVGAGVDGQLGQLGQPGGAGRTGGGNGGVGGTGGKGNLAADGYNLGANDFFVTIGSTFSNLSSVRYPVPPNVNHITSDYGAGCTNSQFILNRTRGNAWVFDPTLPQAPMASLGRPGVSNNITSDEVIVYTNTLGTRDVKYTAGSNIDFKKFIHVTLERQLPEYVGVPTKVCNGEPVLLQVNNNPYAISLEYSWEIQQLPCGPPFSCYINDPTVPASIFTSNAENPGSYTFPINNTTNPIRYQIRYSVKDICCGWSIPVYWLIDVEPEIKQAIKFGVGNDSISFCIGGTSGIIQDSIVTQGAGGAPYDYKWLMRYNSTSDADWTEIPSATSSSYTPAAEDFCPFGTFQFVRLVRGTVISDCNLWDTSNVVTAFVQDEIKDNLIGDPGVNSTCISINGGTVNFGLISGSQPSVPGGEAEYKWEVLTGGWGSISGQNGTSSSTKDLDPLPFSFEPPAGYYPPETPLVRESQADSLKRPMEVYFRRIVTAGSCPPSISNTAIGLVNNNFVAITNEAFISGPAEVCPNSGSITLRLMPDPPIDIIPNPGGIVITPAYTETILGDTILNFCGDTIFSQATQTIFYPADTNRQDTTINVGIGSGVGYEVRWFAREGNHLTPPNFANALGGIANISNYNIGVTGEVISIPAPTVTTTYFANWYPRPECTNDANVSAGHRNRTVRFIVEVADTCVCSDIPGIVKYAPDNVTTTATLECEDSTGWTWYYVNDSLINPHEYLFAIEKKPAGVPDANTQDFTAEVDITVTNNPTNKASVFYAEDLPSCEANFVLPRYWNVRVTSGSIDGFVRTRFFYKPAELAATSARADDWVTAHQGACTGAGLPIAKGPAQVFKNTDHTPFDPNALLGHVPSVSDILPTTINDQRYIAHLFSNLPYGAEGDIDGKHYVEVVWDGFSGGGIAIRVSPDIVVLPITLVSFTGSLAGNDVLLNWTTASELNNDYFIVEKSADARSWIDLNKVEGHGTTSIPHDYDQIDTWPYNGVNYYRLKQVDYDGTIHYSNIISIDLNDKSKNVEMFSVRPNPTSGLVNASIISNENQQVSISIKDMSNRLMGAKEATLSKGMNLISLDLSKYPAAAYILSFTSKDGVEYREKVIKQ